MNKEIDKQKMKRMLENLGAMFDLLAHDLNNALAQISGFAELSLDLVNEDGVEGQNLNFIYQASKRAASIIRQLMLFRSQSGEQSISYPDAILRECQNLLRHVFQSDHVVVLPKFETEKAVEADQESVRKVISILYALTFQAVAKTGGKLEIGVRNGVCGPELEQSGMGDCVEIYFSGSGPNSKNRDQKNTDQGGSVFWQDGPCSVRIDMARQIAEECGGILCQEAGRGGVNTLRVLLPARKVQPDYFFSQTGTQLRDGELGVLVVDDEPPVVSMVTQSLEKIGVKAYGSYSPVKALEFIGSSNKQIDLVITDLIMPEMSGIDFAERLLSIRPNIPIMVCTGFEHLLDNQKALSLGLLKPLSKPFKNEDLMGRLATILGQGETSKTAEYEPGNLSE